MKYRQLDLLPQVLQPNLNQKPKKSRKLAMSIDSYDKNILADGSSLNFINIDNPKASCNKILNTAENINEEKLEILFLKEEDSFKDDISFKVPSGLREWQDIFEQWLFQGIGVKIFLTNQISKKDKDLDITINTEVTKFFGEIENCNLFFNLMVDPSSYHLYNVRTI